MADLKGNNPITADGDYQQPVRPGRRYFIRAAGTFDSGTLKVQDGDGTTWVDIPGASGTSDFRVEVAAVMPYLNFNLSGAGSPSIQINLVAEASVRG